MGSRKICVMRSGYRSAHAPGPPGNLKLLIILLLQGGGSYFITITGWGVLLT